METIQFVYDALASFFRGEWGGLVAVLCFVVSILIAIFFGKLYAFNMVLTECNPELTETEKQNERDRAFKRHKRQLRIVTFVPVLVVALYLVFRIVG